MQQMEFLVYSISNLGIKPKFEIVYANLTEAKCCEEYSNRRADGDDGLCRALHKMACQANRMSGRQQEPAGTREEVLPVAS